MRYVSNILSPLLKNLSHLLINTEAIIAQISHIVVPRSSFLYKFDVKDYYLSGKHEDLANIVERFVAERSSSFAESKAVGVLTYTILNEQYVQTTQRVVSDSKVSYVKKVYKVCIGSGMGLLFAGDVSDVVYYEHVEKPFLLAADSTLVYYARFRDDVFMILNGPGPSRHALIRNYLSRNSIFKIELESTSYDTCSFLDLNLYKGPRHAVSGYLDFSLHAKETALWRPLAPESMLQDLRRR
jgi:hypothetical protein